MCHVDNLLIFGKNDIRTFQNQIPRVLKIKYLGEPCQFLGIELTWAKDKGVRFRQLTRIDNTLKENGMRMENFKPIHSPITPNIGDEEGIMAEILADQKAKRSRSIFGSL